MEKLNGSSRKGAITVSQVTAAVPASLLQTGGTLPTPAAPQVLDKTALTSNLLSRMEQKASNMEKQAATLQNSTKNLEKRLQSMTHYAKEMEGRTDVASAEDPGRGRSSTYASSSIYEASSHSTDARATGFSKAHSDTTDLLGGSSAASAASATPGARAWQQQTKALQKLFDVDPSLKKN